MKVLYTDNGFASIEQEKQLIEATGALLNIAQCKTAQEVITHGKDADALLVQWAPITEAVIDSLTNCKVIVRIGIGVDNVAIEAATKRGIAVCNVPDYCLAEVADHTIALALTLARQIPFIHQRTLKGIWNITPDAPLPALSQMTFATIGLGRIAQEVHHRITPFGCKKIAFDPFVTPEVYHALGIESASIADIFKKADILSLHAPLTTETKHLINSKSLKQMKPTAIIVNTARGGLVDTIALAEALQNNEIAAAGIDVFETEPLPETHPLRSCEKAILTSHVAWYSEQSVPTLQKMAAQEIVRALQQEPLKNVVNPTYKNYETH